MKITYSKAIIKDVKKIKDKQLISRIEETVSQLKNAEAISQITRLMKLKGHPTAYRIRIGDYRLGFYFDNNKILLARFFKRNDIYKLFPDYIKVNF